MKHKLTYLTMLSLLAASCSSDDMGIDKNNTLSGDGNKTPIAVQTNLEASVASRAVDKKFEAGDVLLAYIEAGVTTADGFNSDENPFKGLKTLTLTADADNTDGDNHTDLYNYTIVDSEKDPHITETEDAGLQKLYWDDYSSTEKDLRADGAGIRLKYGYCYNGGTPSTALDEAAGTLGWTIGNQTDATTFKKTDLLFAKTQAPVSYLHGTEESKSHGILVLPYSHAMSKITVNVTAGEGFSTTTANFESAILTLQNINTVCSVDAPAGTVISKTPGAITTWKFSEENMKATYQAIIAPGTNLSVGNLIAKISSVDGNYYDIPVSVAMLTGWASKLTEATSTGGAEAQAKGSRAATIDAAKGYRTQSGVHYILNVTIDKQKITVRATLADWDKVEAGGTAQILFNSDVIGKGNIAEALQTGGFDIYKSSSASDFSQKSTTATYAASQWSYSPVIYWAGQNDKSYFRAVAPKGRDNETLNQGVDILWGTSGNDAITPRTGDVPLKFEHLMSKLCINLETVSGDAQVDLTDAKIMIGNMAIDGTFNIVDGSVSYGSPVETMLSGKLSGFTEFVIPQTISDNAKITITLQDGSTYSVLLNQCKTSEGVAVDSWTKGNNYTYTIRLTKQEITFSAEVKEWIPANAGGNATLDWD